jgi:hypothetical protein
LQSEAKIMAVTSTAIFGAVVSGRMQLKCYDCAQYHGVIGYFRHKRRMLICDRLESVYLNV